MSQLNQNMKSGGRRSVSSTTRSALIMTSSAAGGDTPAPMAPRHAENTYKMSPDSPFPVMRARSLVESVLEERLCDKQYEPSSCNAWAVEIADLIRQRVKDLLAGQGVLDQPRGPSPYHHVASRFKIVAMVSIGQKCGSVPELSLASRCIWNAKFDTYVEGSYTSSTLYAVALVYGLYAE